ncbi:hypothetical protein [Pseudodesulfovibrio sediminis]|uniref:Uncharacterized protein n=1 Tax=Pseudodesulfovibrio sediminis TaxID=2810563 RepID=A0ABN6ERN2_9BACT|nr:hypothetical protein [Pseudodesulfovibrio sediminis]BCS89048.1 hypothetical protein PSDVSF_22900 [Pseudodesulfovibrio sediminis]
MSMDNDTRLMMMNMRNGAQTSASARARKTARRPVRVMSTAAMASFALTLFTRGA